MCGRQAELVVLDVAHGGCTLIVGERTVIVDLGPGSALLHYLTDQGIDYVEAIVVSHADADHLRGLVAVLGSTTVALGTVFLNTDSEKGSQLWADLNYALDDYRRRDVLQVDYGLFEGKQLPCPSEQVVLEVVAPRGRLVGLGVGSSDKDARRIDSNTMSAVIRVDVDGRPCALLCGDLDSVGLDHLLDAGVSIQAPVLVFPHHGGHTHRPATIEDNREFTLQLVNAVRPEVVLFSIGRGLHGTPRPEIVVTTREALPHVRVACTQLSEHCSAELPTSEPTHLVGRFAAGRARRRCCAGTIVLPLGRTGSGAVVPAYGEHRAFIDVWAPMALCTRPLQ